MATTHFPLDTTPPSPVRPAALPLDDAATIDAGRRGLIDVRVPPVVGRASCRDVRHALLLGRSVR